MSEWTGKSRGNSLGYNIFLFVLKYLGLRFAYFFLFFVAFYFLLFSKSNGPMYDYFRNTLKYSKLKSVYSIYLNYVLLGMSIIDKTAVFGNFGIHFKWKCHGRENLEKIDSMQKGGFIISAHIGNYDIAGIELDDFKTPLNIVVFDGESKKIKEALERSNVKSAFNLIFIRQDMSHVIEIANKILNKEIVIIHGDRFMEGSKYIETTVMNRKCKLPKGPFQIAARLKDVPVVFAYGFKKEAYAYNLHCSPIHYYTDGNIETPMRDFVSMTEEMIKKYPLHWFNYFYFWERAL